MDLQTLLKFMEYQQVVGDLHKWMVHSATTLEAMDLDGMKKVLERLHEVGETPEDPELEKFLDAGVEGVQEMFRAAMNIRDECKAYVAYAKAKAKEARGG